MYLNGRAGHTFPLNGGNEVTSIAASSATALGYVIELTDHFLDISSVTHPPHPPLGPYPAG